MQKNSNLIPFVCRIQFADKNDVQSINDGTLSTRKQITLKEGKSFTDLYFTPGSISFREPTKNTPAGDLYIQKLEGFFPGDDESNISDVDQAIRKRHIVKFQYNTGFSKIIGSIENPAKLIVDNDTSQYGRKFSFECSSLSPSYIYEATDESGS